MISKYSKYVPLNLPDDKTTELFVKGMEYKAQKIEQNVTELQSYSDALSSVDIARVSDKEYFDSKYNELLKSVNDSSTVDFSNPANIRKVKSDLGVVLNDSRIINARKETENYRNISSEWETTRSDPRLMKNFRQANYNHDMRKASNWLNSEDPMARIGLTGASLYDGIFEELNEAGQKVKASTNEFQVTESLNALVTEKNKLSVNSIVNNNPRLDGQLRIEYENKLAENPEFDNQLQGSIAATRQMYVNSLNDMMIGDDLQNKKSAIKPEYQNIANYYRSKISELDAIDKMPPDQKGFYVYKNNHAQGFVAQHASDRSATYKKNESYFELRSAALADDKFKLDLQKEANDLNIATQGLDIDRERLQMDKAELAIKAVGGSLSPEEGAGNVYTGPMTMNLPVVIPEGQTFLQTATNSRNELFLASFNTLKATIEDVKSLKNSRQIIDGAEAKLKSQGINIDLDAKDISAYMMTPVNLAALTNALDSMVANSGKDVQNPTTVRIRQGLANTTNINTLFIKQGIEIKNAQKAAMAEMKINKIPTVPKGSKWDPIGNLIDDYTGAGAQLKKFNELTNKYMKNFTEYHYQPRVIPLVDLEKKTDDKHIEVSTYLKSVLLNKGYVVDEKGNAHRTSKNAVVKEGTSSGSTDNKLVKDIDFSKSKFIYLDPVKSRMQIQAFDKDDNNLGLFYLPLDKNETYQLTTKLGSTPTEFLDHTQTEDSLYDRGIDKATQEILANAVKYISASDLGIPGSAHITYRTIAGSEGKRIFKLDFDDRTFELHNFKSLAHMKSAISTIYRKRAEEYKRLNPSAEQGEVRAEALNHTMLDMEEKE